MGTLKEMLVSIILEFRMGSSFVKIPRDGCNVGKIVKLWSKHVQKKFQRIFSWVCLGMLRVGAIFDRENL